MTNSWQRCASGKWSVVINCAKGTICIPAGYTKEFRTQHDGSVNGGGVVTARAATFGGDRSHLTKWTLGIWAILFGYITYI